MQSKQKINARLIGLELYFDDLQAGKHFYGETLGLKLLDEEAGHYARFSAGEDFVCLERKGTDSYPSRDKAVVFLEVPSLAEAIRCIGDENTVTIHRAGEGIRRPWAAMQDPEGYSIVLA
jgi:predicted enzyme related to lactoylglutathione lyase